MKNLFSALVKAQTEIKNLYPDGKGYGYQYVELSKVIDMLKEVLPKYELGYMQMPCDCNGKMGLRTIVFHSSGESVESTCSFDPTNMKGVNLSQATGASLTYFRRYALCSAFGIAGDKDTDCASAPAPKAAPAAQPQPKPTPTEAQMVAGIEDAIQRKEREKAIRGLNVLKATYPACEKIAELDIILA